MKFNDVAISICLPLSEDFNDLAKGCCTEDKDIMDTFNRWVRFCHILALFAYICE